jgi:tetratricopeptide (TPR) repeat protein
LAPLALLGAWRRRGAPEVRGLLLGVAVYALLLAAFFVCARYRLPLVLWLLPLAADEALNVARLVRAGQARSWLPALTCLVLLLNLPNAFSTTFDAGPAERGVLTATAWRNQGNSEQAERLSAALLRHFPADPNVLMLRAELFLAHGSCRDASPLLNRLVELAPRTATPRVRLADCYVELGNWRAAERELANALAIHPYHPLALRSASLLFAQQRRSREASALLARFLAAGYHDPNLVAQVRDGSGS